MLQSALRSCVVLVIGILFSNYHANAQSSQQNDFLRIYIGFDISHSRFESPFSSSIEKETSYSGVAINIDTKLNQSLGAVFQINSYGVNEDFMDLHLSKSLWDFMGGFRIRDQGQPFYGTFLAGVNRSKYTIDEYNSEDFPIFNGFVIDGSLSFIFMENRYSSPVISVGAKRVFEEDVPHINFYIRIGFLGGFFSRS